jgi:PAS domain S-box-containing protein
MALIRGSLTEIAQRQPADGPRIAATLSCLLDVELAIMLESYRDDFVARLQHIERSEREALGASLARTEHRYVNAVELAHVLVVGLDAAGRIVLFNREAERVTGFARDEALGRPLLAILRTEDERDSAALTAMSSPPTRFEPERQRGPDRDRDGDLRRAARRRPRASPVTPASSCWQLSYAPSDGDDVSHLRARSRRDRGEGPGRPHPAAGEAGGDRHPRGRTRPRDQKPPEWRPALRHLPRPRAALKKANAHTELLARPSPWSPRRSPDSGTSSPTSSPSRARGRCRCEPVGRCRGLLERVTQLARGVGPVKPPRSRSTLDAGRRARDPGRRRQAAAGPAQSDAATRSRRWPARRTVEVDPARASAAADDHASRLRITGPESPTRRADLRRVLLDQTTGDRARPLDLAPDRHRPRRHPRRRESAGSHRLPRPAPDRRPQGRASAPSPSHKPMPKAQETQGTDPRGRRRGQRPPRPGEAAAPGGLPRSTRAADGGRRRSRARPRSSRPTSWSPTCGCPGHGRARAA